MDNIEKIAFFCLLSLYNRGGGETPSEQGLCRESASDFGTFHPQKFSKLMVGLGLGDFIFDCLGLGGKKHFYRARQLVSRKRNPGAAAGGPRPSWALLSRDCDGGRFQR